MVLDNLKNRPDCYFYNENGVLLKGNAFDIIPTLPENVFDLIIIDPPYGLNIAEWDSDNSLPSDFPFSLKKLSKENCSLYIWTSIGEKSQPLVDWFALFKNH